MHFRNIVIIFGFLIVFCGCSFGQPVCPSGDTLGQLATYLQGGPCSLGAGIVLYGPLSLQSSVMPVNFNHRNVSAHDIVIQFGYEATTPPTIKIVTECAICAVTQMQSSQIEVGAYVTGTLTNFGAMLANWSPAVLKAAPPPPPTCMPFSELDAEIGAGNGVGVKQVRTSVTYQHNEIFASTPDSLTFVTPQPVTFNLMQAAFNCSYKTSYSATIFLSQPTPAQ